MCAYFMHKGERVKVYTATISPQSHNAPVGTVLDDNLSIACGENTVLQFKIVQRAGKKPMPVADFMQSPFLKAGDVIQDAHAL